MTLRLLALLLTATLPAFGQGFSFRDAGFVSSSGGGGAGGGGGGGGSGQSADYLAPYAYFKLEESPAGPADDATTGNRDLSVDVGPGSSVTGKVGNAYSMTTVGVSSSDSGFEMSGADWAIRFWIYRELEDDLLVLYRNSSTTGNGFEVDNISTGGWKIKFFIGGSGGANVTGPAMTTSQWHRVVIYHDHGTGIGIKVDNGSWTTASFTSTMATVSASFTLQKLGGASAQYLDEVAIWKGYIPTDSELTYDWNSGSGRTYPLE